MSKYVTRQEMDIWGNDRTVTRREPTAYDVGSAIGTGLGMLVVANRNAKLKAAMSAGEAAHKHLTNGEYEKAIVSANSLIAMTDKDAKMLGHYFKANAHEGLGQSDEALKEYTTALDMARASNQTDSLATAFIGRGRCYIQKNDLGAAMRDFTAYLQVEPREDIGYFWQAVALQKLGDLDQALTNINQAISLNPGDAANYRERAVIYTKQTQTHRAIEDYSRAITLEPNHASSYSNRGALYDTANDPAKAIADYSRAIELDPQDVDSYKARADLYQRTGDTSRAAADQAQVNREEPFQRAYNDYLQAATTAYNQGITATYTKADINAQPNWGGVIVQSILLGVLGVFAIGFCGNFAVATRQSPLGISALILLGVLGLVWVGVAGARKQAANKAKAASVYHRMLSENEAHRPGFEQFFAQFLQARKESRLDNLRANTRPFFESGPGNRVVQANIARG